MSKFTFPRTRLTLVPKMEELCRNLYAEDVAADPELNLIDHLAEWHMESVSEAGYTEASADQRRSLRAFARVFRYKTDDLKRVKAAVGWDAPRDEYREFGFASLLTQMLSICPEFGPALKEAHNGGLETKGPYGRSATLYVVPSLVALGHEYQMEVGDLPDTEAEFKQIWLAHMVNEYSKPGELGERERSLIAFASLLRVGDIDKLVNTLSKAGLRNDTGLQLACAESIVGAVRLNRALAYGVSCSQPSAS
jgi:hypothetical protein